MTHELKIKSEYLYPILKGDKRFEVRKNDRNFQVGDLIHLREFYPATSEQEAHYGKSQGTYKITYLLNNEEYCKGDYVIFGFESVDPMEEMRELTEWEMNHQ